MFALKNFDTRQMKLRMGLHLINFLVSLTLLTTSKPPILNLRLQLIIHICCQLILIWETYISILLSLKFIIICLFMLLQIKVLAASTQSLAKIIQYYHQVYGLSFIKICCFTNAACHYYLIEVKQLYLLSCLLKMSF